LVNYSEFNKTPDHSLNVFNALKYCAEHNEDGLKFEKGKYEFYSDFASEEFLCVSNHDMFEMKRIAFLITGYENFTLDGGGSEFIFHNAMVPIAVINSKNVVLKNFSIDNSETMMLDCEVNNIGDNYIDVLVKNNDSYFVYDNSLWLTDDGGHEEKADFFCIRSQGDNIDFIAEARDIPDISYMRFEEPEERKIRIYSFTENINTGTHIIIKNLLRHSCGVFICNSKDICTDDIYIYRSYGMGVIAQKTENISINRLTVKAKEGRLFSLSADATHFVHCKGTVKVTNCCFSEQQDDALNIHGVYTKIVGKTDAYIIVKYMHHSAVGLNIYEKGSEFNVLNPKTLIPYGKHRILDAEVINMHYTKLYVDGGTDKISVGDIIEDITWSCNLVFKNNKVFNNRARGLLIACKGKVEISDNYFSTPGVAILFESDGQYWFESGGTEHVEICNNVFENCMYTSGNWGENIIEVVPREEIEEGKYYHKFIKISDNKFIDSVSSFVYIDNTERVIIENNLISGKIPSKKVEFKNCGTILNDL